MCPTHSYMYKFPLQDETGLTLNAYLPGINTAYAYVNGYLLRSTDFQFNAKDRREKNKTGQTEGRQTSRRGNNSTQSKIPSKTMKQKARNAPDRHRRRVTRRFPVVRTRRSADHRKTPHLAFTGISVRVLVTIRRIILVDQ